MTKGLHTWTHVELRTRVRWAPILCITLMIFGVDKNNVTAQGEKKHGAKSPTTLSLAETKAIAEEGYIYGLPIVMNYAVMYAYAIDANSGQFKAPFNVIKNEHRV